MREVRDPKAVTIPVLARLAVLTDDNDEMRSYFIAAGGAPRLSQLAAADHPPLKGGRQGPHINTDTHQRRILVSVICSMGWSSPAVLNPAGLGNMAVDALPACVPRAAQPAIRGSISV